MSNCRRFSGPSERSIELSATDGQPADKEFPYRKVIGSFMYISTRSRPDIAVVVSMLARHVEKPGGKH